MDFEKDVIYGDDLEPINLMETDDSDQINEGGLRAILKNLLPYGAYSIWADERYEFTPVIYRTMLSEDPLAEEVEKDRVTLHYSLNKDKMDDLEEFMNNLNAKTKDEKGQVSLGQVIEEIVPSDWCLSPEAAVYLENTFKDTSLITNKEEMIVKIPRVSVRDGHMFIERQKCEGCREYFPSSLAFYLDNFFKKPIHSEILPEVPCPSCKKMCPLQFVWRYMCEYCVKEEGGQRYLHKILCTSCNVADLTHPQKGTMRYATGEDYLQHGIVDHPMINSDNPLFRKRRITKKTPKPKRGRRKSVYTKNRKKK